VLSALQAIPPADATIPKRRINLLRVVHRRHSRRTATIICRMLPPRRVRCPWFDRHHLNIVRTGESQLLMNRFVKATHACLRSRVRRLIREWDFAVDRAEINQGTRTLSFKEPNCDMARVDNPFGLVSINRAWSSIGISQKNRPIASIPAKSIQTPTSQNLLTAAAGSRCTSAGLVTSVSLTIVQRAVNKIFRPPLPT
jgi:hypothetical protein